MSVIKLADLLIFILKCNHCYLKKAILRNIYFFSSNSSLQTSIPMPHSSQFKFSDLKEEYKTEVDIVKRKLDCNSMGINFKGRINITGKL